MSPRPRIGSTGMEPPHGADRSEAGWLEVVLLIVSALGALAVVVMIVGVFLPNSLKVRPCGC
jgi:uncharacterized membrane-anchored protein